MTNILELLKNEKVEWKKLGEVCETKFWMMPATPKFISEKGIPYITGKNIKNGNIDYNNVNSLRIEAVQKLSKVRPSSIGQASRISGVSPADITVLLVYLETYKEKKNV